MPVSAAQGQDLDAYRQLDAALSQAEKAPNGAATLRSLDQAEQAFSELRPSLRDPQLSQRIQSGLDQSRAALARTSAEQRAQSVYTLATARQALYTQTLQDLVEKGWSPDVQARLSELARDTGLSSSGTEAMMRGAKAARPEAVAARLQEAAAQRAAEQLEPWGQGKGAQVAREDAYLRLTRARGWGLLLTDLPGAASAPAYQAALVQLAAGNLQGAEEPIRGLYKAALSSATQARSSVQRPPEAPSVTSAGRASAETASSGAVSSAQTGASLPTPAASQASAGSSVILIPGNSSEVPSTQAPSNSGTPAPQVQLPRSSPPLSSVDAPSTPGHSNAPGDIAAPAYAALARALAAATVHDAAGTRAALRQAAQSVSSWPSNWQTAEARELTSHLGWLAEQPQARESEIAAQLPRLQALEAAQRGEDNSQTTGEGEPGPRYRVEYLWDNRVQAVAFFLLALMTPLPFYYKAQALGRRGAAWNHISLGIGLLLVPLILEGTASVGTWLGSVLEQPTLLLMANLSVRHSSAGQFAWWLFSLVGLLLLIAGFRQLRGPRERLSLARRQWDNSRHTTFDVHSSGHSDSSREGNAVSSRPGTSSGTSGLASIVTARGVTIPRRGTASRRDAANAKSRTRLE